VCGRECCLGLTKMIVRSCEQEIVRPGEPWVGQALETLSMVEQQITSLDKVALEDLAKREPSDDAKDASLTLLIRVDLFGMSECLLQGSDRLAQSMTGNGLVRETREICHGRAGLIGSLIVIREPV
jgi:hypothetical protein